MARLTIEDIDPALSVDGGYYLVGMKDGVTAKLSVGQILDILLGTPPSDLNTLEKLAGSIGDDPDFYGTMASALAAKANASSVTASLALKQNIASNGLLTGFRNKLINGAASISQRGGQAIAAGASAYVFDRWLVTNNTNQTVTVSQVALGFNSGFGPGRERFAMRYAFSSAPTTGTLRIEQRIEDVTSISAGDHSLVAWIKGPTGSETLAAEIVQNFGTGGSPSSEVVTAMTFAAGSPTTIYDVSTNRRAWGVTVPAGTKVLGSAGNDYLAVAITMTPRQVGNYEMTWSSFCEGTGALQETDPFAPRHPSDELRLCQRYYEASTSSGDRLLFQGDVTSGSNYLGQAWFKVAKRTSSPTVVLTNQTVNRFPTSVGTPTVSIHGFVEQRTANASGASGYFQSSWTASAEL